LSLKRLRDGHFSDFKLAAPAGDEGTGADNFTAPRDRQQDLPAIRQYMALRVFQLLLIMGFYMKVTGDPGQIQRKKCLAMRGIFRVQRNNLDGIL
jgi:hypothetical protein